MAADPIHVGLVYLETDYLESDQDVGSDSQGDRFILSFTGGAPDTELRELRIITDKDGDGISVGDPLFDTAAGGRGKNGYHGFQVVRTESSSGRTIAATAEVEDGGQELIIRMQNFRAGDRLEFTLDVDEVLRNVADLDLFNSRLDVITSGQEFQDSLLGAIFSAPHYEDAAADAVFLNDFGDPAAEHGLDLPPDEGSDVDSRPNRSAAAVASTVQTPKPVSIGGRVWLDNNLSGQRDSAEAGLEGVQLALFRQNPADGSYQDTGFRTVTDASGRYEFATSLGLPPGTYRVVETQPDGLYSVAAIPGSVNGVSIGTAESLDVLSGIEIPLGDLAATEYNFAEAAPAEISGYVYRDDNDNGRRDPGEPGLEGVRVRLVPVDTVAPATEITTTTSTGGGYAFSGLPPGSYELLELDQPAGLMDGRESVGLIDGQRIGRADHDGDRITEILIHGGGVGVEYNFGELPLGSLSGFVYVAAPGEDCDGTFDVGSDRPVPGAEVILETLSGAVVAQTTTDEGGRYQFGQLPKGTYRIREITPEGLFDGGASVGRIGTVTVGDAIDGGTIENIVLAAGARGVEYNFCEAAPATISGYVYHDRSDDGRRDNGESGISGVRIDLVDSQGRTVASTATDSSGHYRFTGVRRGEYSLVESQPDGYLDGRDTPGQVNGKRVGQIGSDGDSLRAIRLAQGVNGIEYNFGELLAASLSGQVHVDRDGDCVRDPEEPGLADVAIRLVDDSGREVARTTTDSDGRYRFDAVAPGNYTVIEQTPTGYFEGSAKPGSAGGRSEGPNRIIDVGLRSGQDAVDYDFCELEPASLAGAVFVDRDGDCFQDAGERGLADVRVDLLDASGRKVAETRTDGSGNYRFENLRPGRYVIYEHQPAGFFHGGQRLGSGGGEVLNADRLGVELGVGVSLVDYNFCELEPSSVGGTVFVDRDGDCDRDPDESPLAGVQVDLFDEAGRKIAQTSTDADGRYRFDQLRPGSYVIFEHQPEGYFQGGQKLGSGGGEVFGPDRLGLELGTGQTLTGYNFCELAPAELSGTVWSDIDLDGRFDPEEQPLAGVDVQLVDAAGSLVASATTDAAGRYRFRGLAPGQYEVRELQPEGYFHGGQQVGSVGGRVAAVDRIADIVLASGVVAEGYDFPEVPPATLSGYVFQDGAALTLNAAPDPETLRTYRDGERTADDTPLAGVVLELRNVLGQPLGSDRALPGHYSAGPIRVVTDAEGHYEFTGLRPGTYHVYQVQPEDYIDGLDTPGTSGGLAVNPADQVADEGDRILIQTLSASGQTDPNNDAILKISLAAGGQSRENNFSEIRVAPPIAPPPEEPRVIERAIQPLPETFVFPERALAFATRVDINPLPVYADEWAVSWHLSVINGGFPGGPIEIADGFRGVSWRDGQGGWDRQDLDGGRWWIGSGEADADRMTSLVLGHHEAIALTGDFNGDGFDEPVLYVGGQWFVDLNGNGRWDEGDLWIQLGTPLDRPVVGDWDGDGKDDVAIFGRQWQRDPTRIRRDPGLPDPDNRRRRKILASREMVVGSAGDDAGDKENQHRWLRRGRGGPLRADVVDHVFQYGEHIDTPLAGDWNGDGIDQIGVFRGGQWLLDLDGDGRWTGDDKPLQFGRPGDEPIVGDFNGDGIDEIAVVRGDVWIIDSDGDGKLTGNDQQIRVPRPAGESQPVVGDFNGDGKVEPGYYEDAA